MERNNDYYREFIEHINVAVWICDSDEKTTYANPKFCDMLGYSFEEINGRVSYEFWDAESIKLVEQENQKRKQGLSSTYEGNLIAKDGRIIPVRLNGTPNPNGGTMGIITDLTEVKEQEYLYKMLVENVNEGVWMDNRQEKCIFINRRFREMLGYSEAEILGKNLAAFADVAGSEKITTIVETDRKNGISSSYEINLVTKSGQKVPVMVSGTPLKDGVTIAIISDLSEMKRKDQLYRKLVEHMNEAVWMVDNHEQTIYTNPKFTDITEYKQEEMMGKGSREVWDEDTLKKVKYHNQHYRKKGISSSYDGMMVTKSGKRIPVLISGAKIGDIGTMGIMTDLRPLKEKEKQEVILNTAIQYATDAIVVFDHQGEIQSWNKGAQIVFGYKKNEIIGKQLDKIFSKKDVQELLGQSEIQYNTELNALNKNKSKIKISTTITPITDEDGDQETFYLLIARDITHQHKFEEEVALKYQKIKEAYQEFGQLKRHMDYLLELVQLANEHRDEQTIADFIVSSIIMLTKVDACVLRKFNHNKETLELVSSFGLGQDWRGKSVIKYKNSLASKAFKQNTPLKIIDIGKEPRYQSKYLAKKMDLCSLLLIPLEYNGKQVGSLSLYTNPEKKLEIFENDFIEKYAKLIELIVGAMAESPGK